MHCSRNAEFEMLKSSTRRLLRHGLQQLKSQAICRNCPVVARNLSEKRHRAHKQTVQNRHTQIGRSLDLARGNCVCTHAAPSHSYVCSTHSHLLHRWHILVPSRRQACHVPSAWQILRGPGVAAAKYGLAEPLASAAAPAAAPAPAALKRFAAMTARIPARVCSLAVRPVLLPALAGAAAVATGTPISTAAGAGSGVANTIVTGSGAGPPADDSCRSTATATASGLGTSTLASRGAAALRSARGIVRRSCCCI